MNVSEPRTPPPSAVATLPLRRTGNPELSLSIVIITRNTKDLLGNLLKSIEADNSLKHILKDVIVIDNYSTDGTNTMVQEEFPRVFLHKNDRNRGFAAAANMGISHSKGDYILFLNSDTLLLEGEVAAMMQFMEENPDVGICGPQLVYEDMKPQRSFAHIPSLLFEIVPRSFVEFLFPGKYSVKPPRSSGVASPSVPSNGASSASIRTPNSSTLRSSNFTATEDGELRTPPQEVHDVPSLIGAAIIVRKELLEDLGGFDERFFFFLEETDLCVRARGKGARVVYLPHTKVVHLQGRTVRKNWVQGRIQYNISLYKFIRKHHTSLYYHTFQGIRFLKSFLVPLVLSVLPLFLFHKRTRRTYIYYLNLLRWHMRGCPDDAGLLVSSPG